jgi:CRP-like cAMP-binding protein
MSKILQDLLEILEHEPDIYEIVKYCPYEVLREFRVIRTRRGEFTLNQGTVYDKIYFLVTGYMGVYVMAENGRKYTFTLYKKGNFIGELEILDQLPFICNVETLSDVTLLELPRDVFLKWMSLDQNISSLIMRCLSREMYALTKKAASESFYPLRHRICQYLVSSPSAAEKVNINAGKLSDLMAVTARSINRVLKDLRDDGLIGIEKNSAIILNRDALKRETEIVNL